MIEHPGRGGSGVSRREQTGVTSCTSCGGGGAVSGGNHKGGRHGGSSGDNLRELRVERLLPIK